MLPLPHPSAPSWTPPPDRRHLPFPGTESDFPGSCAFGLSVFSLTYIPHFYCGHGVYIIPVTGTECKTKFSPEWNLLFHLTFSGSISKKACIFLKIIYTIFIPIFSRQVNLFIMHGSWPWYWRIAELSLRNVTGEGRIAYGREERNYCV